MTTEDAGFGPGPDSPGVTVEQAAAFLGDRFGPDATAIEALRQGAWSSAYGFVRSDTGYVIRFSAHVDDFQRDRLAYRYVSPGLPIPVVTEIGDAFGIHYAISERVAGIPIDDVNGHELRELLPSMLAALDAMRSADVSDTGGYGGWGDDRNAPFPSWEAALLAVSVDSPASRGSGWRERLETSPVGAETFDEAYATLVGLSRYAPRNRSLIHSDLLNYNVLVSDRHLTGVIDWGCAMYGDFLYDLAWL
ncbi:MAG: aminoglycoside phosphotransferase family protein, partial [Chloroflexota bacterium]|nr:aminoglycoside phosphotransferase family protein [Chloroflexota bacterium]